MGSDLIIEFNISIFKSDPIASSIASFRKMTEGTRVSHNKIIMSVMKLGVFLLSLVIALFAFQAIGVFVLFLLAMPIISGAPKFVSSMIFIIGSGIAIYSSILIFRRIFNYLKDQKLN
jgi:hypothetical protein